MPHESGKIILKGDDKTRVSEVDSLAVVQNFIRLLKNSIWSAAAIPTSRETPLSICSYRNIWNPKAPPLSAHSKFGISTFNKSLSVAC